MRDNSGLIENGWRSIVFDRQRAMEADSLSAEIETPELSETERDALAANVRLLALANGHAGSGVRELLREANGSARHLADLHEWSKERAKEGRAVAWPTLAFSPAPRLLSEAADTFDLQDRLAAMARHPDLEADDYADKQQAEIEDVLGPAGEAAAFPGGPRSGKPLRALLEHFTYLPEAILASADFKDIPLGSLVSAMGALRDLETQTPALAPAARQARARVLDRIVADRLPEARGTSVAIDARGLWLNNDGLRLHDHLPYGLVSRRALDALGENRALPAAPLAELAVRRADEASDREAYQAAMASQMETAGREYGGAEKLVADLAHDPARVARWCLEKKQIVPDLALAQACGDRTPNSTFAALRFGETVQAALAGEKLAREPDLFLSHRPFTKRRQTYEGRSSLLHDPRSYNAVKAVRFVTAAPVPENDPDRQYLAFRSGFRQTANERHSFIETVNRGRLARVLIDENAWLNEPRRRAFEALPNFERGAYEQLEDALRTYEYFLETFEAMPKTIMQARRDWQAHYREQAETAMHFLLTNVTGRYDDAERLGRALLAGPAITTETARAFHDSLEAAVDDYGRFLYENAGEPQRFHEAFSPEIRKNDVSFSPEFLVESRQACAGDGYDEKLTLSSPPVRVVEIAYRTNDPTETVPYQIELSALDALRLDRNRPLINVIGGARFVGERSDGVDPLAQVAAAVLRVGHEHRANIAVPGTQSGFGLAFGRENVNYKNEFAALPRRELAHMFAISPGGHTYYPGNARLAGEKNQTFALNAVDSIMTPFRAGWADTAEDFQSSTYRNHIAYMESLYARVASGQPKALIIGNGGFWSIFEAVESLKRGFTTFLIKGSGRFADAAAALLEERVAATIGGLDDENLDAMILETVRHKLSPESAKDFLSKDFGSDPAPRDERYRQYRLLFRRYIREAALAGGTVRTTTVETVAADISAVLDG